jgi:hypothetical protein
VLAVRRAADDAVAGAERDDAERVARDEGNDPARGARKAEGPTEIVVDTEHAGRIALC